MTLHRLVPLRILACTAALLGAAVVQAADTHGARAWLSQYQAPAAQHTPQLLNYVKSNLDGSRRVVLSLYLRAPLELEVLKAEADGRHLALVQARLDPQTLSEAWMRSYNQLERGPGQERLQMQLNAEPGAARRVAEVAGTRMPVVASQLPAHVYNFDLSGLNITLPLLKNPRADFQVGIVDPDFKFLQQHFRPQAGELPGGFADKGLAQFRYLGDETLDEIPVHRYEVSGPAFAGVKGSLWVNARDRFIERFEHAQPDNPDWNSFKLQRISARPMDAAAWAAFKDATVRRAMALQDAQ